jgi:glycosyltransferase involved in cell wall biosynthesis
MVSISISFASIRLGWLENTFRALGQQTLPHDEWELTFIDDFGDRSAEVEKLARENRINVKYMHSKPYYWKSNRQLGNARNTGFIHSDGEIIVFLDDYTWIPPTWLQRHWEIYNETRGAVIGRVKAVRYRPIVHSLEDLEVIGEDDRYKYLRCGRSPMYPSILTCPNYLCGWFYTFNASAPLMDIVRINGYDEEFDCTGEDDVDLGQRLRRIGTEFTYRTEPEIIAYHMQHGGKMPVACPSCGKGLEVDTHCWDKDHFMACPNCGAKVNVHEIQRDINIPKRFREEEVHKVTKELYNVKYDGSWGLLERNRRRQPWEVNGGYFNLAWAREHEVPPEQYPHHYKEFMYGGRP